MIRWILLAAVLASIPYATDRLVDWRFKQNHARHHENVGYSASERAGMDRLVEGAMWSLKPAARLPVSREDIKAPLGRGGAI